MTTKFVQVPGWTAGARTIDSLSGNGVFQFQVDQAIGIVCGLNDKDNNPKYLEIDHAFFIESGQFRIIEQGIIKTPYAAYSSTSLFEVVRINEEVRYYVDGVLIYESLLRSTGTVFGDCSLYAYLDSVTNAQIGSISRSEGNIDLEVSVQGSDIAGNFANIDLGITANGTGIRYDGANVDLNLYAFGSDLLDTSIGHIDLEFTISGETLSVNYNSGEIDLNFTVYSFSGLIDNNEGNIDLGLSVQGSEVFNYGLIDLGLSISIFEGYKNRVLVQWSSWTTSIALKEPVLFIHETSYGHSDVTSHYTTYESENSRVSNIHESSWSLLSTATHHTTWASSGSTITSINHTHTTSWLSSGSTLNTTTHTHTTSWLSSGSVLNTAIGSHNTTWNSSSGSTTFVSSTHNTTWNSSSGSTTFVLSSHTTTWNSSNSLSTTATVASHTTAWKGSPLLTISHTTSYQSVVESFAIHTHTWKSFIQENVGIHQSRYRSYTLDSQFISANAYIEPDIQLLKASVTADEDSPYYQCEVELRNAKDYQNFVRDQAFILHLFADEYHFVVDNKSLTRTIDDEGNYQESATLSGLSPLCLNAAPRSIPITKTWDTPKFASAIVYELIGSITWNLVDWMIPAFRLSADHADPFEIAQNIVSAVGGLLESQPDGSVIARHRWPISIAELDKGVPQRILSETEIYSAQEQPTQDVLMNQIRIMDSNAGYQDRLEYEPNDLNGEDDPWNGVLYAYLSPWRDNCRIVTTRGSKIQIGNQTESTKQIFNENDENTAETLTFESGQSSTQYPIMTLNSFTWLDENLGGLTFVPYATTLEASAPGTYFGYSLAEIAYTTRRLQVPVQCLPDTKTIEAQFLLLETTT